MLINTRWQVIYTLFYTSFISNIEKIAPLKKIIVGSNEQKKYLY